MRNNYTVYLSSMSGDGQLDTTPVARLESKGLAAICAKAFAEIYPANVTVFACTRRGEDCYRSQGKRS